MTTEVLVSKLKAAKDKNRKLQEIVKRLIEKNEVLTAQVAERDVQLAKSRTHGDTTRARAEEDRTAEALVTKLRARLSEATDLAEERRIALERAKAELKSSKRYASPGGPNDTRPVYRPMQEDRELVILRLVAKLKRTQARCNALRDKLYEQAVLDEALWREIQTLRAASTVNAAFEKLVTITSGERPAPDVPTLAAPPPRTASLMDEEEWLNINESRGDGMTTLYVAAELGQVQVVEALLAHGALCGIGRTDAVTPLHAASLRGHTEVAKLLLRAGADARAVAHNATSLMLASHEGHTDIAQLLLARTGQGGSAPVGKNAPNYGIFYGNAPVDSNASKSRARGGDANKKKGFMSGLFKRDSDPALNNASAHPPPTTKQPAASAHPPAAAAAAASPRLDISHPTNFSHALHVGRDGMLQVGQDAGPGSVFAQTSDPSVQTFMSSFVQKPAPPTSPLIGALPVGNGASRSPPSNDWGSPIRAAPASDQKKYHDTTSDVDGDCEASSGTASGSPDPQKKHKRRHGSGKGKGKGKSKHRRRHRSDKGENGTGKGGAPAPGSPPRKQTQQQGTSPSKQAPAPATSPQAAPKQQPAAPAAATAGGGDGTMFVKQARYSMHFSDSSECSRTSRHAANAVSARRIACDLSDDSPPPPAPPRPGQSTSASGPTGAPRGQGPTSPGPQSPPPPLLPQYTAASLAVEPAPRVQNISTAATTTLLSPRSKAAPAAPPPPSVPGPVRRFSVSSDDHMVVIPPTPVYAHASAQDGKGGSVLAEPRAVAPNALAPTKRPSFDFLSDMSDGPRIARPPPGHPALVPPDGPPPPRQRFELTSSDGPAPPIPPRQVAAPASALGPPPPFDPTHLPQSLQSNSVPPPPASGPAPPPAGAPPPPPLAPKGAVQNPASQAALPPPPPPMQQPGPLATAALPPPLSPGAHTPGSPPAAAAPSVPGGPPPLLRTATEPPPLLRTSAPPLLRTGPASASAGSMVSSPPSSAPLPPPLPQSPPAAAHTPLPPPPPPQPSPAPAPPAALPPPISAPLPVAAAPAPPPMPPSPTAVWVKTAGTYLEPSFYDPNTALYYFWDPASGRYHSQSAADTYDVPS